MKTGSARAGAADELLAVEDAKIKSVVEKPLVLNRIVRSWAP